MRPRTLFALAFSLVAAVPAAASGADHSWQVGPLVPLNGPVAGLHCANDGEDSAPLIALDPRSAKRVVATYLTDNGLAQIGAVSNDGGRSWTRSLMRSGTTCTGGASAGLVDPGLIVDAAGYAVSSAGWVNTAPRPTDVNHDATRELTNTLAPGARQFGAPVDVEPTQPDQRGYLTELGGRLYLETERFDAVGPQAVPGLGGVAVLVSDDHGRSWSLTAGQPASAPPGHQPVAGGIVAVGSDLVATWPDVDISQAVLPFVQGTPVPSTLTAATSSDGGKTWSTPVPIAPAMNTLPQTSLAPDGAVLVSWEDVANGGMVRLARSTDAGATWTVTNVAPGGGVGFGITSVAADQSGTIAVLHEQAVAGGSGELFREVLSTSTDEGATWDTTALTPVMDLATYPNPDSSFDGVNGAEEQVVATPRGFLAAFPVFRPLPLVDGDSDVAVVQVSRR